MKRLDTLLNTVKKNYLSDKLAFILLSCCYISLFFTITTLPLFTYTSSSIITNALSILSVLSISAYLLFRGKIIINSFIICYVLFVVYAVIITIITSNKLGFDRLTSIITLYGLTIFIMEFCFNRKTFGFFCFTMCIFIIIFIGFFTITYKDSILSLSFDDRFGSDYGNVNQISTIFVIGFLFLLYVALSKKKYFLILLLPAAICLFYTILTGSRWGIISFILGFSIVIYFLIGRRYKIEFLIIIFVAVMMVLALMQLPFFSVYRSRFKTLFSFITKPNTKASSTMRLIMIFDGLKMWLKNIVFGFGADGFYANTSYGLYSHSTPIELLTNFGLIGFILFSLPIYQLLSDAFKLKRDNSFLFISGMVVFFIAYSLFSMFHLSKPGMICLGFFIGYSYYINSTHHRAFILSFNENKKIHLSLEYKPLVSNVAAEPTKIKKIGFVISSLHKGGAERVASILANQWIQKGLDVTFFLTARDCPDEYSLNGKIKVIKIVDSFLTRYLPSFKINKLTNEIEKEKPDILVSFLITPMFYASCVTHELGIPLVCSERNDPTKSGSFLLKILKLIAFNRAKHIVFQDKNAQDYFNKKIVQKSSIISNPSSVSINGAICKTKTIITAGRLSKQKGYDVLINSFKGVSKKYPDYKLKIYGNGPLKKELNDLIIANNLEQFIDINPFTDSLHEEMAASMVFVSSSRYEGMSNTICEALLLGLPVVATNCPIGLANQLISEHKNGEIAEFDNSADLSNKICNVLENLTAYEKNASNMVPKYKELFDPSIIADRWISMLNEVKNEN